MSVFYGVGFVFLHDSDQIFELACLFVHLNGWFGLIYSEVQLFCLLELALLLELLSTFDINDHNFAFRQVFTSHLESEVPLLVFCVHFEGFDRLS